jgi:hypothetical protein
MEVFNDWIDACFVCFRPCALFSPALAVESCVRGRQPLPFFARGRISARTCIGNILLTVLDRDVVLLGPASARGAYLRQLSNLRAA